MLLGTPRSWLQTGRGEPAGGGGDSEFGPHSPCLGFWGNQTQSPAHGLVVSTASPGPLSSPCPQQSYGPTVLALRAAVTSGWVSWRPWPQPALDLFQEPLLKHRVVHPPVVALVAFSSGWLAGSGCSPHPRGDFPGSNAVQAPRGWVAPCEVCFTASDRREQSSDSSLGGYSPQGQSGQRRYSSLWVSTSSFAPWGLGVIAEALMAF